MINLFLDILPKISNHLSFFQNLVLFEGILAAFIFIFLSLGKKGILFLRFDWISLFVY